MSRPYRAGALLVLAAAALWASFGIFAKYLYTYGFSPLELASIRTTIGFLGVAVFALRDVRSLAVPPRDLLFLAAYGILGFALFEVIFLAVFERTTVAIAVALLYTAPAFVVLLSRFVWKERIGGVRWGALALVLVGVTMVTGALDAILRAGTLPSSGALVLGVAAGLSYALYTMLSKVATQRYGARRSLFWSFGFAALALAVAVDPVTPVLRRPQALPALLGLGLIPTLFAYSLYLRALGNLRASTASMLSAVEPVIATLLAAAILRESVTSMQGIGMLLVVTATVMLAREVA